MVFHIKSYKGEGFRINTPEGDIEVMLREVNGNGHNPACMAQIDDSGSAPRGVPGVFREIVCHSRLKFTPDIFMGVEKYHPNSQRARFYIDKPSEYNIHLIRRK